MQFVTENKRVRALGAEHPNLGHWCLFLISSPGPKETSSISDSKPWINASDGTFELLFYNAVIHFMSASLMFQPLWKFGHTSSIPLSW